MHSNLTPYRTMPDCTKKPPKSAGNTNRKRTPWKRRCGYRLGPKQYPTIALTRQR